MRGGVALGVAIVGCLATCNGERELAALGNRSSGQLAKIVLVTTKSERGGGGHFGPSCSKTVHYKHADLRSGGLRRELPETWTENDRAELLAAPDGLRIAYRQNGGPWRPVWPGRKHLLLGDDTQRIGGATVDWKKVPTLAAATTDIFQRASKERSRVVEELEGTPALSTLLTDTVAVDGELNDAWSDGFRAVTPEQQEALRVLLRTKVVAGDTDPDVLMRFATHAPIQTNEERQAVLKTLSASHTYGMRFRVKDFLLVQAARVNLGDTAEWACREVARYKPDSNFYPAVLFWVMAKKRHACDAALKHLDLDWCSLPAADSSLDRKIDNALGKLVDDPSTENAAYIEDKEALLAFAVLAVPKQRRDERCRGNQDASDNP